MKDHLLGYINVDFQFEADIQVNIPESGFLLQLGQTGTDFYPNISFSGSSGYLFDQSGNMFGGYIKGEAFKLSGNYFYSDYPEDNDQLGTGRLSYFFNDVLMANNINGSTGFIDNLRFEDYGGENNLAFTITPNTGSPCVLSENTGSYLLSSDNYYLICKS